MQGRLHHGGVDRNVTDYAVEGNALGSPPSRRRGSKPVHAAVPAVGRLSPPSRRRGSKPRGGVAIVRVGGSPPSRRRGSKRHDQRHAVSAVGSPPSRRRGSKQCELKGGKGCHDVASITEAWIETGNSPGCGGPTRVASITEAWIETRHRPRGEARHASPPSRRRGSKHSSHQLHANLAASPPSRRRGSKLLG